MDIYNFITLTFNIISRRIYNKDGKKIEQHKKKEEEIQEIMKRNADSRKLKEIRYVLQHLLYRESIDFTEDTIKLNQKLKNHLKKRRRAKRNDFEQTNYDDKAVALNVFRGEDNSVIEMRCSTKIILVKSEYYFTCLYFNNRIMRDTRPRILVVIATYVRTYVKT